MIARRVPIEHIGQRAPKRLQIALDLFLVRVGDAAPDKIHLDAPIICTDVARDGAGKEMILRLPDLLEALRQIVFLPRTYLDFDQQGAQAVICGGNAPGGGMFARTTGNVALEFLEIFYWNGSAATCFQRT